MPLSIPPTKVFWCEPTGRIRRSFRCYDGSDASTEPPCRGYCNAMRTLDEIPEEFGEPIEDGQRFRVSYDPAKFPPESFPTVCDTCGKEMAKPQRQIFTDEVMVIRTGPRAGEEFARRDAPVGAMWDIAHYHTIPEWCGCDGIALNVVTPGGEWSPDSIASNCTKKDESPRVHRCWVRRGDPRTGYVHVDKDATIQETCAAGAGSIWQGKDGPRDWHGFLYKSHLIDADESQKRIVDGIMDAPATAPSNVAPIVPLKPKSVPPPRRTLPAGAPKAFGHWRASRRR